MMTERLTDEQKLMVERNIRLAYWAGQKFRKPAHLSMEEWTSDCLLQLVRAVYSYDPAKGNLSALVMRYIGTDRHTQIKSRRSIKNGGGLNLVSFEKDFTNVLAQHHDFSRIETLESLQKVMESLSGKHLKVVKLMATGKSHAQIAKRLRLKRTAITEIFAKVKKQFVCQHLKAASA
jgi:RNA polymerase sigma factor (sigma-70 family)